MVFFTLRSLNAFLLLEISAPDKFVISVCIFRFTKLDERYSVLPYYYVMAQLCSFVSTSVRCAHGRIGVFNKPIRETYLPWLLRGQLDRWLP